MTLSLTYKGFNYVSYYNGAYENADSLAALAATGANAVALPTEYGIDVNNSDIYTDPNYTDSLTALGHTIDEAKALGLSVMVRPLIDFLDPNKIGDNSVGDWRAYFNPSNPAAFFASYKSMIVAEAEVAQQHGADQLSLGVEIDQLTGPRYLSYWTDIIASVRAVFSGKLTYSANWNTAASPWAGHNGLTAGTGNLATQVSFWNQIDSVGIDAYPALSDAAHPTEADLVAGWTQVPTDPETRSVTGNQSLISYFQSVAAQTGKPLLFTELGYESATDAASQPAGSSTHVFDPSLQANLYQAFFDAWGQSGNGALKGVYFWNWDPNASEVGPGNGANFSPQGLAAQNVVTTNFTAASPPASPVITAPGNGGLVATHHPTIAGTGLAGATATIYVDGGSVGTTTTDGTGHWSYTLVTSLADGAHSATATETAGAAASAASAADVFTVDTTPPALSFTDTGTPGDGLTNNGAVQLSGAVSDAVGPVHVEVFDGATDLGAAIVTGGSWTVATTLAPGLHNAFAAVATDAAGNSTTATNPASITIDTTLSAPSTAGGTPTDTGTPGGGSATDTTGNGATGTTTNPAGSTVDTTPPTLLFASVAFTDAAGNSAIATNPASITVDTTPPTLAIDPTVTFANGAQATLTGTVADPAGVTNVEIFQGAKDLGAATLNDDGSFSFTHVFGRGLHAGLVAVATDMIGNATTRPTDFDLVTGVKNAPYAAEIDTYDSAGTYLGAAQFTKTGALYLSSSVTTLANGDLRTAYTGGSYFDPLDYYAFTDIATPDGSLATETLFDTDGGFSITGYQDDLKIQSIHDDTMTGGGVRESFVFKLHFGQDTITDFQFSGSGHDILNLSSSEFSSIAAIIQHTTMQAGNAVIHVSNHDTITLQNVTKAELKTHGNDFKLHA